MPLRWGDEFGGGRGAPPPCWLSRTSPEMFRSPILVRTVMTHGKILDHMRSLRPRCRASRLFFRRQQCVPWLRGDLRAPACRSPPRLLEGEKGCFTSSQWMSSHCVGAGRGGIFTTLRRKETGPSRDFPLRHTCLAQVFIGFSAARKGAHPT